MILLTGLSIAWLLGVSLFQAYAQLEPPPYNIVPYISIAASSTCGTPPTMWCRISKPSQGLICDWCNAANRLQRHNAHSLIYDDTKWWQSENDPKEVTILFNFLELFHISEIIVTPGPLPLPAIWSIEKSENGVSFKTLKRFVSETENCRSPVNERSDCIPKGKDNEIIRVALEPSENLMALRLRFTKPYKQDDKNIHAKLLTFYTLQHVKILGECKCRNWYKECELLSHTQRFICKCPTNKCGRNCDDCCPGFIPVYKQHQLQCIEPSTTTTTDGCKCEDVTPSTSTTLQTTTTRRRRRTTTTMSTTDGCTCPTTTTSPIETTTSGSTPCSCTGTTTSPPTTTTIPTTTTDTPPTDTPCTCSTITCTPETSAPTTTDTPTTICTCPPDTTTETTPTTTETTPTKCTCTDTTTETPTTTETTPTTTETTPTTTDISTTICTCPPDTTTETTPTTTETTPTTCTCTSTTTETTPTTTETTPTTTETTPTTTDISTTICTCPPDTTTETTPTTTETTPTTCTCTSTTTETTPTTTETTPTTTETTPTTTDISTTICTCPPDTTTETTPTTTETTPTTCTCTDTTTETTPTTTETITTTTDTSTETPCTCTPPITTTPYTTTETTTIDNTPSTPCSCWLSKTTTEPELPPVVTPVKKRYREQELSCRTKMVRNLNEFGMDVNDWLCSITDIHEFPMSKRWPHLLRDLNYKLDILDQMIQRAPDKWYFQQKYHEYLVHIDPLERYSHAQDQRIADTLDRCHIVRLKFFDFVRQAEEVFEIDAQIYKSLAYVKFVNQAFHRRQNYYSDADYSNEIEPLFHGIVSMNYYEIYKEVNKEFTDASNHWNRVLRITSDWNYNIVFKLREKYESNIIPRRVDDLNQRVRHARRTSEQARSLLREMKNSDSSMQRLIDSSHSSNYLSLLPTAQSKILMARYTMRQFRQNMKMLRDYEVQLINHLKTYWDGPQLIDVLTRKEIHILNAVHYAQASMHMAKRFTNVIDHNRRVSDTIFNVFFEVLDSPEKFRDTMCYVETYPFSKSYDELLMSGKDNFDMYETIDFSEDYNSESQEYYDSDTFVQNSPVQRCRQIGDYSGIKKDATLNLFINEIRRDNDDIIDHAVATEQRVLELRDAVEKTENKLGLINQQIKKTRRLLFELQSFGDQADSPLQYPQPYTSTYNHSLNLEAITKSCKMKKSILTDDKNVPVVEEAVKLASDDVGKVKRLTDHVQSIEMRTKFINIEQKIRTIKQQIETAKKLAESIKGAVRFESPGHRRVPLASRKFPPSVISHLEINFKSDDGDGLILSTGNITQGLSIELKLINSHLQVKVGIYNLTGFIQFPKEIVNNLWYHVDIFRLGPEVTATVSAKGIEKQSQMIKLKSLNNVYIPIAMPIYIAGIPEKWKLSKQDDFDGCLDKFKLNNAEISLFASETSSGFVEACIMD